MGVRRKYRSPVRGFVDSTAGTISVRLTKKLAEVVNGMDLSRAHIGDLLTLPLRDGQMLVAEGWAVFVSANVPLGEAADTPRATSSPSIKGRLRPRIQGRRRSLARRVRPALAILDDWHLLTASACNALLVGPARITRRCMEKLRPQLDVPIVTIHPGAPPLPPGEAVSTLILKDVAVLSPEEQQRLFEWLSRSPRRVRVISTSAVPLMTMVSQGSFLESLYYRLNTVFVNLAD
jgi:hypothetical protein